MNLCWISLYNLLCIIEENSRFDFIHCNYGVDIIHSFHSTQIPVVILYFVTQVVFFHSSCIIRLSYIFSSSRTLYPILSLIPSFISTPNSVFNPNHNIFNLYMHLSQFYFKFYAQTHLLNLLLANRRVRWGTRRLGSAGTRLWRGGGKPSDRRGGGRWRWPLRKSLLRRR